LEYSLKNRIIDKKKIKIEEKKIPLAPIHFLNRKIKIELRNINIGGKESTLIKKI